MTIIWSDNAGETFQKNIDYLLDNWSEIESTKFITRVFQYLDALAHEPLIARKTYKTKHTYRCNNSTDFCCITVLSPKAK